jgi:nitrilase
LGELAREHEVWLVTGVTERDPAHPARSTTRCLFHGPDGELALKHRKLVPTNTSASVWGRATATGSRRSRRRTGRLGGLVCWENYMPLARFRALRVGDRAVRRLDRGRQQAWQSTLVHIARESRCFVIAPSHFQRAASYPDDFPLARLLDGVDVIGRGGSAILGPDGSYLAGPLWDEEGVLYAELDPARLDEERQRFDPTGHYHRPEVFRLDLTREG